MNRRNKLFTFKHNAGQPFTDWVKQLHAIGDECEVDKFGKQDLWVMLYLTGVNNPRLSEKLFEVKDPTPTSLYAVAEAWETAQGSQKGLHPSKSQSNSVQATSTGHSKKKGSRKSSLSSSSN